MKRSLRLLLFLVPAAVVGCGQGQKELFAPVKGTVTYNGKPIDKGWVTFSIPGYPPTTMDIVDGQFSGTAQVGKNLIQVSAKKKTDQAPAVKGGASASRDAKTQIQGYMKAKREVGDPPPDYDPTMVDYIPPEWGVGASREWRNVEAHTENEYKFDIKGKS